jgi:hypothetical protein
MKKLILPCGASMDIEEDRVEEALILGHRLVGCAACNPRLRLTWFQRKFGERINGAGTRAVHGAQMSTHSLFSPSAAHRWIPCPGSAVITQANRSAAGKREVKQNCHQVDFKKTQ